MSETTHHDDELDILVIETALNYWRELFPAVHGAICKPARVLADCYGTMIYEKQTKIARSALTQDQKEVLDQAHSALATRAQQTYSAAA